ncbi:hypothetical protein [Halorubrum vacuolatum]|uniref:RING-type E3 ubiquitin transferase n=1 Tax=Halorubrum vacuolatum TaxID=63740 RepID=A0A238UXF8_HALVU|nr:hypothetical protein [Halorubrum vacuolatum]SNR25939.1 hypothetical protein SAMN06264855_101423 [Halorubrum vacuolatum]
MSLTSIAGAAIILLLGSAVSILGLSSLRQWNQTRLIDFVSLRDAAVTDGSVMIGGTVRPIGESRLTSPVAGETCVAYEFRIERRSGNSWSPLDSGSECLPFLIDDGTAVGYVDPSGEDLFLSMERVSDVDEDQIGEEVETKPSLAGRRRYYEGAVSPGEKVYVQGSSEPTQDHNDADMRLLSGGSDLRISDENRRSLMRSHLRKGLLLLPVGILFVSLGLWILL